MNGRAPASIDHRIPRRATPNLESAVAHEDAHGAAFVIFLITAELIFTRECPVMLAVENSSSMGHEAIPFREKLVRRVKLCYALSERVRRSLRAPQREP